MQFLIAGASGFLGRAWTDALRSQGHHVVTLVRREARGPDEATWDPASGSLDRSLVEDADVVANLAGASNVHVPWTDGYRRTFLESRTGTTRLLATAVAGSERKPAFLAQNGISGYGDRGAQVITEDTPTDAETFMAEVTRKWEAATAPAVDEGVRVVVMRTAVVLSRRGGALKTMLPAFRMGVGGPIGPGDQYFSTISLVDWLGAATHLALSDGASGAYNLTGPDPSTNAEFAEQLGKAVHRPAKLKVPSFVLRGNPLVGPIGGEVLASQRIEPARLLREGFAFAHNDIHDRIASALL
jgi:uncharacterized protein